MATKGMYKLDDENCYPTNCFPARSLLRPRYEEGAGHWQVARQTAEKNKIEFLFATRPSQVKWKSQAALSGAFRHLDEKTLDGAHLMKLHHVKSPSQLCSVDINNQNFVSANEHDFEQFSSVAYINATENLLTLEAFRKFPGLRELELSLNGLRNLKIHAEDFPHLEILDLSYNNLSPEDVQALGVLPHLKVLHLTANGLSSLPLDLASPESESFPKFPALEVLLLDDNHLSHPNVFVSLANLRSLKQLNLDKNGIKEVPYLQHTDHSCFCIHPLSAKSGIREGLRSRKSAGKRLHQDGSPELSGKAEYIVVQNGKDPDRTEIVFPSWSPDPPTQEDSPSPCLASKTSCASPSPEFTLPLPELRFLSLANNQIEQEEDLLAVALFPSLTELTFHSNPFTTSRSGDPPLLTSFLQNKLGIKLVRKKISKLEKPRIFIPNKANRKVKTQLPKVRKRPLMLEAPPETTFWQLWTGDDLDPNKRPSLADPLPPIRSYSIPYDPEQPIIPPLRKEDMSAPPSAVSSISEEMVLEIMPTAQCSLDALLFGSVPSTRSSLDEILSRSFPPRRSVSEEQGRLDLAVPAETHSAQQDLSGPLPPEENLSTSGPPMKNPSAERDPSENAPLISLPLERQDQREPVPPPNLPLQEPVPAPGPPTPEQDLPKRLPPVNSVTKEDESQPVTPPNSPLVEQSLSEGPAPPSEPPAEEQDLARTLPPVRSLSAEENLSEALAPARVPVVEQDELEPIPPASSTSQALGLSEFVSPTGLSAGILPGTLSLNTSPLEGQDHIELSPPCISTSKVEGLSGIISSHPSGTPSLTTFLLEGQDQVELSPPCISTSKLEGLSASVSEQPSGILSPTISPVEGQDHVELSPPCISTSQVKGLSGYISSHPSGTPSPTSSLEGHDQVEPALPNSSTSPGQALLEPMSLATEEQGLSEPLPPTRSLPADQDQLESVPLPTSPSEEHNLSRTIPPTKSEGEEDLDGSLPPSSEYHLQTSVPTMSPPAERERSEPAPPAPSTFQGSNQSEYEPWVGSPSATPKSSPSSSSSPENQNLMDAFPFSARTVPSVLVPPSQSTSGELYKLFAKAHSDAVPFGLSGERSSEDEMSHSSGEFVEDEESESFFMTQGDEASGSHLKPLTEEPQLKQPREDKKREYQNVPEKYKGYEELLGGDPGPDFIEPLGIQQNVKALEKALRYQRVYRESKAKLDTFQKPFVPAEKKALRVPAPPAQKTKVERLEEILLKMRNPTNIVQVPLVCILRRKKENWREYREALALLKEFRKNYKATVASCNLAGESKSMSKNGVDADVINQNQLLRTIPKVKVNKEQLEEEFPFRVTQEDEGLSSILPEKNFPPTQQC